MSPSEVTLAVTSKDKDILLTKGVFNSTIDGIPFTDNEVGRTTPATKAYTGRCIKFDLSEEKDREAYGDLCAKFMAKPEQYIRLWEDRVQQPTGGLFIYLSYIELSLVSQQTIEDLK